MVLDWFSQWSQSLNLPKDTGALGTAPDPFMTIPKGKYAPTPTPTPTPTSGRVNNPDNNGTGVNEDIRQRIKLIRLNYNYPDWFENTMNWTLSEKISVQEFKNAHNDLIERGMLTLRNGGTAPSGGSSNYVQGHLDELYRIHGEQESRITDAYDHRMILEGHREKAFVDRQDIWSSITDLHTDHAEQETRISSNAAAIASHGHDYAGSNHSHGNGNGTDCEWYDIGCKMDQGFAGIGKLALIGGLAVGGIFLLKMRLGK